MPSGLNSTSKSATKLATQKRKPVASKQTASKHTAAKKAVVPTKAKLAKSGVPTKSMGAHRIFSMSFASVYPAYIAKVQRKGRTQAEVDEVIRWLTGYTQRQLEAHLQKKTDFEHFFAEASRINPLRRMITGVICGVRIEDIEEPLMQEIRYLDKLVDELAKGRPMGKILRQSEGGATTK